MDGEGRAKAGEGYTAAVHNVPPELLLHAFMLLGSARDILTCWIVCRRWAAIASDNQLWRHMLRQDEVSFQASDAASGDYLRAYKKWYIRYWGFHSAYTRIQRSTTRLEKWLRERCPRVAESLNPGLEWMPGQQIPTSELAQHIPYDDRLRGFIMAYHFHDGQRFHYETLPYGLLGTYQCHGTTTSLFWLPSRMLQVMVIGNIRILIFGYCRTSFKWLGIVTASREPCRQDLLYHVVRIQSGTLHYLDFGLFEDFYDNYVKDLTRGRYDVMPGGNISMIPNDGPGTAKVLDSVHGIRVSVSVLFCPRIGLDQLCFKYRLKVELTNPDNQEFLRFQITSSRWETTFENGETIVIYSNGVEGEYPMLSVSSPNFCHHSRIIDHSGYKLQSFQGLLEIVAEQRGSNWGKPFTIKTPLMKWSSFGIKDWREVP